MSLIWQIVAIVFGLTTIAGFVLALIQFLRRQEALRVTDALRKTITAVYEEVNRVEQAVKDTGDKDKVRVLNGLFSALANTCLAFTKTGKWESEAGSFFTLRPRS